MPRMERSGVAAWGSVEVIMATGYGTRRIRRRTWSGREGVSFWVVSGVGAVVVVVCCCRCCRRCWSWTRVVARGSREVMRSV